MNQKTKDIIGLIARLILGGVLLYAGFTKISNLDSTVLSVRAYQIPMPLELSKIIGYGLPMFEIILGILVVLGLFTRISALLGTLLMFAFMAAISSAWARGLSIDCGCFGKGGQTADPHYLRELIRDSCFVIAGLWLVVRPKTIASVDNWLFGNDNHNEAMKGVHDARI